MIQFDDTTNESKEYAEFIEKFKPKKTTDDCYTPGNIYDVVLSFAVKEYGLEGREVLRPFYPGGDYENTDYPDGCVVIDNPPFSILSKICAFMTNAELITFYLHRSSPCFLQTRGDAIILSPMRTLPMKTVQK